MRTILQLGLALALFAPFARAADISTLKLTDPRVFAPLKGTPATAAYGTFKNEGTKALELKVQKADGFKSAELHETVEKAGKTSMEKMDSYVLKPGEELELKPGGHHIMLFDPTREIGMNGNVKISFLINGEKKDFSFKVVVRQPVEAGSHTVGNKNCTYTLDPKSVKIGWTAYKTNQKVAVDGHFNTVKVTGKTTAKSLDALLKGITVSVDKASSSTDNPERDKTLQFFFFDHFAKNISAKITAMDEKNFTMSLDLNGKKQDVRADYYRTGNEYKANAKIDIFEFGGMKALSSLNKKCEALHKGSDGVSKTWSDVGLNLYGKIEEKCQ